MKTPMGKTIALKIGCFGCITIKKLKNEIHSRERIPPDHQLLIFDNKLLDNERALSHYKIGKESMLYLEINNEGKDNTQ